MPNAQHQHILEQLASRVRVLETDEPPVIYNLVAAAVTTPPTQLELDAAFGATAAQLRDGWAGIIYDAGAGNTWLAISAADIWRIVGGAGIGIPHDILSATHADSVIQAVTRGSLIYGNATPAWDELVLGGISGSILTRNATDVLWSGFALAGTAGQTYTFPAVSGAAALGAGTLTIATINDATIAAHTHAITSSANPGVAASILASDASGYLQLVSLGIGATPTGASEISGPGGMYVYGGLAANDDLYLEGTKHATKTTSYIILQPTSGNVGIGTTTPNVNVDIRSSGADTNSLISVGNSDDTMWLSIFGGRTTNPFPYIAWNSNNTALRFATASSKTGAAFSEKMRITSGGNVGIGTTGPTAQLHIDQASTIAAIPVLTLDQADLSEEFINFVGTVGAGNSIDTAAVGTYYGKIRVQVDGVGYKYIALYDT